MSFLRVSVPVCELKTENDRINLQSGTTYQQQHYMKLILFFTTKVKNNKCSRTTVMTQMSL